MEAAADWILTHPDEAEADEAVSALQAPSGAGPSAGSETAAAGGAGASSSEQPKELAEKFPDGPGSEFDPCLVPALLCCGDAGCV